MKMRPLFVVQLLLLFSYVSCDLGFETDDNYRKEKSLSEDLEFVPEFNFDDFFQKIDPPTTQRVARKNVPFKFISGQQVQDKPYKPPSESYQESPKKVVKMLKRRLVAEPNTLGRRSTENAEWGPDDQGSSFPGTDWPSDFGASIFPAAEDRSDGPGPLFRGTVEKVLDTRKLQPNTQEKNIQEVPKVGESRIDGFPSFTSTRPLSTNQRQRSFSDRRPLTQINGQSGRPGVVPIFVEQPFRIPSEFRSLAGFDNNNGPTEFRGPFGEPGGGFQNFLKQVGSNTDAFGNVKFGERHDRIVSDEVQEDSQYSRVRTPNGPSARSNSRPKNVEQHFGQFGGFNNFESELRSADDNIDETDQQDENEQRNVFSTFAENIRRENPRVNPFEVRTQQRNALEQNDNQRLTFDNQLNKNNNRVNPFSSFDENVRQTFPEDSIPVRDEQRPTVDATRQNAELIGKQIERLRPFPGQQRSAFNEEEEDDEFEDEDEEEDQDGDDRVGFFGRFNPTFRKETQEFVEDSSSFNYDSRKKQNAPTESRVEKPYSHSYHTEDHYEKEPEFVFHRERSFADLKPTENNIRPPASFETPANNFRAPISAKRATPPTLNPTEVENSSPFPTLDSFQKKPSTTPFDDVIDRKPFNFTSWAPVTTTESEPIIESTYQQSDDSKIEPTKSDVSKFDFVHQPFYQNQVQDFTKVTATTTVATTPFTATEEEPKRRNDFSSTSPFKFEPFKNFDQFFDNDVEIKNDFDQHNFFGFREIFKPSAYLGSEASQVPPKTSSATTSSLSTTTTTTTTATETTTVYIPPTYSETSTTSTSSTTTTEITTPTPDNSTTTATNTSLNVPTPSPVYYKYVDDARFTPGPIYYKPIEIVSSPSEFKTTTEGWRPRIDESIVKESLSAPKEPSAQDSDSYAAPKSDSYSAPKPDDYSAPQAEAYTAPKVDSYGAPNAKPYSGDSYGAPKAEPYDSYGAPKADLIQSSSPTGARPPRSSLTAPASDHGHQGAQTPSRHTPQRTQFRNPALGNFLNGVKRVRQIVSERASQIKLDRNNHLVKSAAIIIPVAVSLL